MVVKKFGSQVVYLSVNAPANGYVIDVVFWEQPSESGYAIFVGCCELSVRVIFTTAICASKLLGCYMVKPHGQLVLVSSTPHSAYTPNLSTS